jgi:hypothetical protein
MNDLTRTILVLVAIPLAAILVPAVLTWARDLSALSRRVRQLEEQSKVITFWENWMRVESSVPISGKYPDYEAERLISDIKSAVRRELADAGRSTLTIYKMEEVRLYRRFPLTFKKFRLYRRRLSAFRRAFLFYKAPNPLAKYGHAFFHFILAEYALGVGILAWVTLAKIWENPKSFQWLLHKLSLWQNDLLLLPLPIGLVLIIWLTFLMRSSVIQVENNRLNYVRDQILRRYKSKPANC